MRWINVNRPGEITLTFGDDPAKLQAVAQKLDSGDYTLLPQVDLFSMDGETKDQSVVAFSSHAESFASSSHARQTPAYLR